MAVDKFSTLRPEQIGMEDDPAGHMSKAPSDYVEVPGVNPSVALISPKEEHLRLLRRTLEAQRATIMRELSAYPTYAQLNSIVEIECDAVIVEIDSDLDVAMDVVETICARKPSTTVMVYSSASNPELMSRSMRAGAREFLTDAIPNSVIQDALLRAAARRTLQNKTVSGEAFVFWGAKGGSGATTIATNFALALRMETSATVALLDLNCRLGDVAVLLGITPRFTVTEALKNANKLDQDLISTLFVEHRSGVAVLAAPDNYDPSVLIETRAVGKLLDVVRSHYRYVVIDAGRGVGDAAEALLQRAAKIYLVTQLDIPSLRNAQRLISYMQSTGHSNVDLVINRHEARKTEIDDAHVSKALGLQPKWKLANDYAAARKTSNAGSPLIDEKSPVAAGLLAMARAASGKAPVAEKRRGFSLFGGREVRVHG